jgi:putative heme iron utilization protein
MAANDLLEQALRIAHANPIATLSTQSLRHPGYPFGSVVQFVFDSAGYPILLLSRMAQHSQNLVADPKCALTIAEAAPPSDALVAGRISLLGDIEVISEPASVQDTFLAAHPDAAQWAGFGDFNFYRLHVRAAYLVAGFGVMGWINSEQWRSAFTEI